MTARLFLAIWLLAAVAMSVTACGNKGSGPGKDWSAKPLTPVSSTVKGVSFTISLPDGMKEPETRGVSVIWDADLDDNFSEPAVTVALSAIPPATLDDAVGEQMFDDNDVVAKKEAIDGGMLIVSHAKDKGTARAVTYKNFGDKVLTCRASQAKRGGVPSFEATLAWLESICMSLSL